MPETNVSYLVIGKVWMSLHWKTFMPDWSWMWYSHMLKSGYQQWLSIVLCCESHVLTYIWAPMASLWFYILFKIRSLFCTDILEFRSAKPALATLQTPQSLCCNYKLNALKTKTDLDIMLLGCQCCQIFPFIQLHLQTGFATTCLKDFILWIIAELITA